MRPGDCRMATYRRAAAEVYNPVASPQRTRNQIEGGAPADSKYVGALAGTGCQSGRPKEAPFMSILVNRIPGIWRDGNQEVVQNAPHRHPIVGSLPSWV
jgi:hypothetical protein